MATDLWEFAAGLDMGNDRCALQDLPRLTSAILQGSLVDCVDLPGNQLNSLELTECYTASRIGEVRSKCLQLDALKLSYVNNEDDADDEFLVRT